MSATLEIDPISTGDERAGFDQIVRLLKFFAGWLQSHRDKVQISYLIPERSGFGWYVVAKQPAFDFELNRELAEFGAQLIRRGFAIHAALIPGSVVPSVPTDGIAITPAGQVSSYAG